MPHFSFFVPADLDLRLLTLTFGLGRDFCTMHVTAKFRRPTFNRSQVIVLTNKQTEKNKQTPLKTCTSLRYATPVGNDSCNACLVRSAHVGWALTIPQHSTAYSILYCSLCSTCRQLLPLNAAAADYIRRDDVHALSHIHIAFRCTGCISTGSAEVRGSTLWTADPHTEWQCHKSLGLCRSCERGPIANSDFTVCCCT